MKLIRRQQNRIQEIEVCPLWRRNIYKTQSNLEVSQSFRLENMHGWSITYRIHMADIYK